MSLKDRDIERLRGIGPGCGRCGHGEGHHRFGLVDGEYRWETPCQAAECGCDGYALAEGVAWPRDYSHARFGGSR